MKAYTGSEIAEMAYRGECPWRFRCVNTKGRYKGWVEIYVSNIPGWPEHHEATIAISAEKYEILKKDSPNT